MPLRWCVTLPLPRWVSFPTSMFCWSMRCFLLWFLFAFSALVIVIFIMMLSITFWIIWSLLLLLLLLLFSPSSLLLGRRRFRTAAAATATSAWDWIIISSTDATVRYYNFLHQGWFSISICFYLRNLIHTLHTSYNWTKCHMFPIEMKCFTQRNEKLRSVRIFATICHAQYALSIMRNIEAFVRKCRLAFISRWSSKASLSIKRREVAALNNELRNDPVKLCSSIRWFYYIFVTVRCTRYRSLGFGTRLA